MAERTTIGLAYLSTGGALKVETFLPRSHAQDIRTLTEYFKALPPAPPPERTGVPIDEGR